MRDVRSWGKTGSGQRWGEPTRLTLNPTSVSQTKLDAASTKEIDGFAVGTVDPKLLNILVRRISKDALEFGLDAAGIDVASSKARLSHPRWQPDDASSETRKID